MNSFGKIAIPSKGETLDSIIDDRFARAKNFIIFDSEKDKIVEVVSNKDEQAHGMGPKVAQLLSSKGVKVVIVPSVGLNAFGALQAAGIEIYLSGNDTVKNAIENLKQGKLKKMEEPTH